MYVFGPTVAAKFKNFTIISFITFKVNVFLYKLFKKYKNFTNYLRFFKNIIKYST